MEIRHIHTPHCSISIEIPAALLPLVQRSVFSCLQEPAEDLLPRHYLISPVEDRLLLYRGKRQTHRNRNVNKIIYALEWQIVQDLIRAHQKMFQFHAAALQYNHEGYLFVGSPGSGKTSLSILLQRQGWQLLSDEFGFVEPESRQMISMPRNIVIKPHLADLLEVPGHCRGIPIRNDGPRSPDSFFVPADTFGKVQTKYQTVLKKLILLNADPNCDYKLEETTETRSFEFLFDHLFTRGFRKAHQFDTLVDLVRTCATGILSLRNPLALAEWETKQLIAQIRSL